MLDYPPFVHAKCLAHHLNALIFLAPVFHTKPAQSESGGCQRRILLDCTVVVLKSFIKDSFAFKALANLDQQQSGTVLSFVIGLDEVILRFLIFVLEIFVLVMRPVDVALKFKSPENFKVLVVLLNLTQIGLGTRRILVQLELENCHPEDRIEILRVFLENGQTLLLFPAFPLRVVHFFLLLLWFRLFLVFNLRFLLFGFNLLFMLQCLFPYPGFLFLFSRLAKLCSIVIGFICLWLRCGSRN